jgi:hypothetical protein
MAQNVQPPFRKRNGTKCTTIPFPEWWLYILCHSFSWMVVVHFVDIGEIFYHHCINFFFIIKEKKFFSIHTVPLKITWLFWVAQVAKWLKLLTSDHKHTCITTNVGSCLSTHFKCWAFLDVWKHRYYIETCKVQISAS